MRVASPTKFGNDYDYYLINFEIKINLIKI